MEDSSIKMILKWCKRNIKILAVLGILLLLVITFIVIINTKNPKTVVISSPENHLTLGYLIESEEIYRVSNGVALSASAATEVMSALAGVNNISSIANDLIGIAEEYQTQGKVKETRELVIPANAWCGGKVDGGATYSWVETSYNYLSKTPHTQKYTVVIVQSMGFYVTFKPLDLEIVVYKISE